MEATVTLDTMIRITKAIEQIQLLQSASVLELENLMLAEFLSQVQKMAGIAWSVREHTHIIEKLYPQYSKPLKQLIDIQAQSRLWVLKKQRSNEGL